MVSDRIKIIAEAKRMIDEEKLNILTQKELNNNYEVEQFSLLCLRKGGIDKNPRQNLIDRIRLSGCISDEEYAFYTQYRRFRGSPSIKYHLTARDCFLIIIALNLSFDYGVFLFSINCIENTVVYDSRYPDYLKLLKEIHSSIAAIRNVQTRFELSEKIRKQSKEYDSLLPFFILN